MITSRSLVRVVACLALMSSVAWAIPMAPGTSANAALELDPLGFAVAAGPLVSPLNGVAFSATITSTVLAGDATNPFPGGLTFVYQVANSPNSLDALGRVTLTGFDSWLTDMSYQLVGGGAAPTTMDRSVSGNGNVVGYSFVAVPAPSTLQPGLTSMVLVVQTNAPRWTLSTGYAINGSIASGEIYAPAVPEPATLLLLTGGLGLMLKRRH
jgi:hypothetical protein